MKNWITPTGLLTGLSAVTYTVGVLILGRGVQFSWEGEASPLLGAGATVVAAATAAIISAQSIKTWKDQRELDRDKVNFQMKQQVYSAIAQDLVNTFPSGSATEEIRLIRAHAAVWGSPHTIRELSQWLAVKRQALETGEHISKDTYRITSQSQTEMKHQLSQVISAMRKELFDDDELSYEEIDRAIFDDSHNSTTQRSRP